MEKLEVGLVQGAKMGIQGTHTRLACYVSYPEQTYASGGFAVERSRDAGWDTFISFQTGFCSLASLA